MIQAPVSRPMFLLALVISVLPMLATSRGQTTAPSDIGLDHDSVKACLREFHAAALDPKQVERLIRQLGDDDFNVREAASATIKSLPVLPRAELAKATQSDDAEVKWRAEELLKQGEGPAQVKLLAAIKAINQQKHKGLLAELLAVFPAIGSQEARLACRQAIAATATTEDAAKLRELLKHNDATLRGAAVAALGATLGRDAVTHVKPLLRDQEEAVQLAAARVLADVGDRDCLETYLRLLESKSASVRWEALASLGWLSGKSMQIAEVDETKRQAMLIEAWRQWVTGEGRTAALRFPLQINQRMDLFNGIDLSDWQAVHSGQRVDGKDVWRVKDGMIQCNGRASGYLRTKKSFRDYELSVDWRWPPGGGVGLDSGVWIMITGPDAALPNGLEAQLGSGNAGDFWTLANFQCKVKGVNIRHGQKFAASSEKPIGQWNTMNIRVKQGTVRVQVNGVEQNAATDCPKEPGFIALQVEGHSIDFRNITLLPLDE